MISDLQSATSSIRSPTPGLSRLASSFQLLAPSLPLPIPYHPSDFRPQNATPAPSPQLQTLIHSIASLHPAPLPRTTRSPQTPTPQRHVSSLRTQYPSNKTRPNSGDAQPPLRDCATRRGHGLLARPPDPRCTSALTSQRRSNPFHRCGERAAAGRICVRLGRRAPSRTSRRRRGRRARRNPICIIPAPLCRHCVCS